MDNTTAVQPGDHVYVRRIGYTHHGVAVSATEVIHFNGEPRSKGGATIRRDTLEDFAAGGEVQVRPYGARLSAHAVILRAESQLGSSGYHLFANNCEHFARWCVTDNKRSRQVDNAKSVGGAGAVAGAGIGSTVYAVAAAGLTGTSGPGIMSGLAAIGAGGATGGLMTLAAAPAATAVAVVHLGLRDHDDLPDSDRKARRIGRRVATLGAGGSSALVVPTLAALGTSGLSAAGISSGLATAGGFVGGGMLAGTAALAAAPAVATCILGAGTYLVAKKVCGPGKPKDEVSGT
jgi:hypothetical protein